MAIGPAMPWEKSMMRMPEKAVMGVDYTEVEGGGRRASDVEFVAAELGVADHGLSQSRPVSVEGGVDDCASGRIVPISLEVLQTRRSRQSAGQAVP